MDVPYNSQIGSEQFEGDEGMYGVVLWDVLVIEGESYKLLPTSVCFGTFLWTLIFGHGYSIRKFNCSKSRAAANSKSLNAKEFEAYSADILQNYTIGNLIDI